MRPDVRSWRYSLIALLLAGGLPWLAQAGSDQAAERYLTRTFDAAAVRRFDAWLTLLAEIRAKPETARLQRVNDFINQQIHFADDRVVWKKTDYWATPLETFGRAAGDCEDFALLKYFSLIRLGIARNKLRLTYVRARIGGPQSRHSQAHMILAYYPEPSAEPLILDNLLGEIRLASRRDDLTPIYSFNHDGIWGGSTAGQPPDGAIARLSRWQDLQARLREQGFHYEP